MNKKRMSKVGAASIMLALALTFIVILLIFLASATDKTYTLGEKIKIEIGEIGKYTLIIKTPNQTFSQQTDKTYFIYQPQSIGDYIIKIKSEEFSKQILFTVVQAPDCQATHIPLEELEYEKISPAKNQEPKTKYQSVVGEPVKWEKEIQPSAKNIKIKIPESSTDVSLSAENLSIDFKIKNSIFDDVSNLFSEEKQKSIVIQNTEKTLELKYTTPAPQKTEKKISKFRKEVEVSSEIHYENVLAYTDIEEILTLDKKENIKIFWKEKNTFLEFEALDTTNNGLINKIEWIVPHLSTQTFEIILIIEAQHLDSSRNFIEDIYEEVGTLDNIWKKIPDQNYVRVTFEKELNFWNDITVFAKGSGNIEVYEEGSNIKIADFGGIKGLQEYKIFLNSLSHPQDTFDLKIIGEIEIDYITDPSALQSCTSIIACIDNGGAGSCDCSQVDTSDNIYLSSGLSSKSSNLAQGVVDLTNSTLIPSGAILTSADLFIEFGLGSGFDICTIEYSTNSGSSWLTLDADCTDETTESINQYDMSSLTETELESMALNFTAWKISGQGSPISMNIDHIFLNVSYYVAGALSVFLNWPEANTHLADPSVIFNYTPTSSGNLINCTLWDNSTGTFSQNTTNQTSLTDGAPNYITQNYSSDGTYIWNIICCDDEILNNCTFSPVNHTLTIDSISPIVNLISPPDNNFTISNLGINFTYNTTDANDIQNCSLIIDEQKVYTKTNIIKDTTQNFEYFLSNGLHNWTINCTDSAGNEGTLVPHRTINVSVPPADWLKRFYETSTLDYTSTANITLKNSRDSMENQVAMSVGSSGLVTLSDSYSPYIGGDGAFIAAGDILFSGVFSTTRQNQEYITWKVYISNSTGNYLVCQSGNDNIGGTKLSSTSKGTYTPITPCNNPTNWNLQGTDRIRLVVNAYNDFSSTQTVTHFWDDLSLSYVEFTDFYSLGSMEVDLIYPTTSQALYTGQQLNVSCNTSCTGGRCINTDIYIQYNTTSTNWLNLNTTSGNLILASGETNPHNLGNVNSTSQITNFTIEGNMASINNIRCIAISDYSSKNGTTTKQITVAASDQPPSINLTSPSDNWWHNTSDITLYFNVSDDNSQTANCSLYINGAFNQSNSTTINDGGENNFTLTDIPDGEYNWSINCTDQSALSAGDGNWTFYIDTELPQPILIYPAIDDIISQSNINFNFSVSDNLDDTLTCNLTVNGEVVDPNFDATNGAYTNKTHPFSIGDYSWNITCIDEAGNKNISETRNFTIIDLPPTINLLTTDYNWFTSASPVLIYNASDNNGITNCSLYIDGIYNQSNSTEINESGENNFTLAGLADGLYNWTLNCTDDANISSQPLEKNFYVDTTAPTINLNLPANESTSLSSNSNFNFTATENLGTITCNLTINSVVVDQAFPANNASLTNSLISSLTDGVKYWNITCWDSAGLTNTSSTYWTNITEYPSVIQNTEDEKSFNTTTLELFYTPSDNTGLESCDLYINGIFNQSNQTTIINEAQNNFTLTLEVGHYNWSIYCTDLMGLSSQTPNRSFTVDISKPTITLNYPEISEAIYDKSVIFNYTVNDDLSTTIECNLTVNGIIENTTYAISGTNTLTPTTFSTGGLKIWNVTCIDDATNTNTSETRNFTLYLPPAVSLTSPDTLKWYNVSTLDFFYNVTDGNDDISNASLIINGTIQQTNQSPIINDAENNFTGIVLSEGQYNWTVNVTDKEGSTGTDTERTFWIDTTSPTTEIYSPIHDEVVTTNNITFNFTAFDNMDQNILCNLTVGLPGDPPEIENFNVVNSTNISKYILRGDGNYSWFLNCSDEAGNINSTQVINFSIVAPPLVVLNNPTHDSRSDQTTTSFNYTPYDTVGLAKCDLYINGIFNETDVTVEKNEPNFFNGKVLSEGVHNWTVECFDADMNTHTPTNNTFYIDLTPPIIQLNSPQNNSGVNANDDVTFNWTATDALDPLLICDLTVDGNIEDTDYATSGFPRVEALSDLSLGAHTWNVTCTDQSGNTNTSETRIFNYTYPDFYINETLITINNLNPTENETITINATIHNLGGVDILSVEVKFYKGDPEDSGIQIGTTQDISIDKSSSNTTSINWDAPLGNSNIFVIIDYPDTIIELNETNNKANKSFSVESWHFFYGSINPDTNLTLTDSASYELTNWNLQNLTKANIYVADYDSNINWLSLQAIGKTTSGTPSTNDIQEIDTALSMTLFQDSHANLYLNETSQINETLNYTVFANKINEVPVATSINSLSFKTGILWDTSDSSDSEYNSTEKEDIIYITSIQKSTMGSYEISDYELRVPATLRSYDPTNQQTAAFYIEII